MDVVITLDNTANVADMAKKLIAKGLCNPVELADIHVITGTVHFENLKKLRIPGVMHIENNKFAKTM